jgi:protein gp37
MTLEDKLRRIKEDVLKHGFQSLFIKDWNGRQGMRWDLSTCASNCACGPACANCPVVLLQKKKELETGVRVVKKARFLSENLLVPLRWAKRHVVFTCPQGDLFHEDLTDENIAQVFAVMQARQDHCYIVLTKRAQRMENLLRAPWFLKSVKEFGREMFDDLVRWDFTGWGRNLLVGVSVEDQQHMDRAEVLPFLPVSVGKVLFTAPLLGEVSISRSVLGTLDWVVCNRERGGTYCNPRPCNIEWIKGIQEQCEDSKVPFFLEDRYTPELIGQLGGIPREYPAILAR